MRVYILFILIVFFFTVCLNSCSQTQITEEYLLKNPKWLDENGDLISFRKKGGRLERVNSDSTGFVHLKPLTKFESWWVESYEDPNLISGNLVARIFTARRKGSCIRLKTVMIDPIGKKSSADGRSASSSPGIFSIEDLPIAGKGWLFLSQDQLNKVLSELNFENHKEGMEQLGREFKLCPGNTAIP